MVRAVTKSTVPLCSGGNGWDLSGRIHWNGWPNALEYPALKGGTAINLFIQDFPRLSVDIDLAYLPLEPRDEALKNVRSALERVTGRINAQPSVNAVLQDNKQDELRIIVTTESATIKIEVSPVARGTLHEPELLPVVESVEDEFGYAEIPVVSQADLYGGKLCAAMDRQHPRDLYDVQQLLN